MFLYKKSPQFYYIKVVKLGDLKLRKIFFILQKEVQIQMICFLVFF